MTNQARKELKELEYKTACDDAAETMSNTIAYLRQFADDLERQKAPYWSINKSDKIKLIRSFVHHVTCNLLNGNIRLDLLVDAAVRIAQNQE